MYENYLKNLYKKFETILNKNNVNSSTVPVYSSYINLEKYGSCIGKLYVSHFAKSFNLDSERFVTYELNPRIKSSINEFKTYLENNQIKYAVVLDKNSTYGFDIFIYENNQLKDITCNSQH